MDDISISYGSQSLATLVMWSDKDHFNGKEQTIKVDKLKTSIDTISRDTLSFQQQEVFKRRKKKLIASMEKRIDKAKKTKFFLSILAPVSNWARKRLDHIAKYEGDYKEISKPKNEKEAFEKFKRREGKSFFRDKKLSLKEHTTFLSISTRFWESAEKSENSYEVYSQYMTDFFKGEHFLFLEVEEHSLYDGISHLGYLRGSSHYDHGTLNGKTGGLPPKSKEQVANPQYGIDAPSFKHLCFGRAEILKDGQIWHFGKMADEAKKSLSGNDDSLLTTHKVTWLQTEGAPDCANPLKGNFWKHRVRDFGIYAFRKHVIHAEKPNVGPYGYGHGDNNPTIIDLLSSS